MWEEKLAFHEHLLEHPWVKQKHFASCLKTCCQRVGAESGVSVMEQVLDVSGRKPMGYLHHRKRSSSVGTTATAGMTKPMVRLTASEQPRSDKETVRTCQWLLSCPLEHGQNMKVIQSILVFHALELQGQTLPCCDLPAKHKACHDCINYSLQSRPRTFSSLGEASPTPNTPPLPRRKATKGTRGANPAAHYRGADGSRGVGGW